MCIHWSSWGKKTSSQVSQNKCPMLEKVASKADPVFRFEALLANNPAHPRFLSSSSFVEVQPHLVKSTSCLWVAEQTFSELRIHAVLWFKCFSKVLWTKVGLLFGASLQFATSGELSFCFLHDRGTKNREGLWGEVNYEGFPAEICELICTNFLCGLF